MIASLSGTLKSISKSEIVLEVNSVGYLLNVSSKVISTLGDIGSKLSMFTDLQVKDDKIIMYGFFNQIDQTIFRLLQSVQGVGPKAALSILSALTVEELILAISSGDKAMISRAEGVGSKVASRVASELSEKVSNLNLVNIDKNINVVKSSQENLNLGNEANHVDNQVIEDAISALVNLGYNRSEVFSTVIKIKKEFSLKHETKDLTVGNIIPLALNTLTQVNK
jgi:Holliday junction DNA helicase RuvA